MVMTLHDTVRQVQARPFHWSLPWTIWGLAALFYGFEFFLQISPGVMVPNLMQAFNVSGAMLGNLAAFYFYTYALLQIPVGVLNDRFGPRRLLISAAAICALGALLFACATKLGMAEFGRALIGFGSAFAVVGAFKLAANWFPAERFALVAGLTVTVGMLGAIFANAPLAYLVENIGWRPSMSVLASLGLLISIAMWFVIRDHPPSLTNNRDQYRQPPQMNIFQGLKRVFAKKQNWLVACYGGLMFAPTSTFAGLWGVPFLITQYGISRPNAAGAISMIFIGWVIGSPLFGWFSDHIQRRKPPLYLASIGGCINLLLLIYLHLPIILLYFTLFLFGLCSSAFLPGFSIIRETNPPYNSATVLGFMNMMNMVGGAILQPLIGKFLDMQWNGLKVEGVRIYNVQDYHWALLILPVILFIAVLLLPFIRETYCKGAD